VALYDLSTDFGKRVDQRLRTEEIIWLTTVAASGQPISVPVWFWWDGEEFLIYSQPNQPKLRHIERHPKVSLNFNSNATGGDITQFDGEAWIDHAAPLATGVPAMIAKYAAGIQRLGATPEGFANAYSVAIRVRPSKVRGH
jgi:PPOX class probable F420-dependent enzyme